MSDEWYLIALIVALPIIVLVWFELASAARSRRERALAQRRKNSGRV